MEKDRLQLLLTIVEKALSLQPDERPGYIKKACGEDATLRTEVYEMLKSTDASESFWEDWRGWNERQMEGILGNAGSDSHTLSGVKIGPWRLLKPLGEGGMGIVYLAERADGSYHQKAALKLLRPVYTHKELRASSFHRFQRERQILANLDHPNIARLFDGGHTEDGHPWLAMEYIDGMPITDWCRQNNCSLNQRLDLFKKICDAIRYAHKNLIVHRDLKPENILVTMDGQIKILDFGIAKLLDEELLPNQQNITQTGTRAMSLYYAAPEQILGEVITTATDVYALGLLLYELIAGTHPFNLDGLNVRRIEQVIRTEEPVKPSVSQKKDSTLPRGNLSAGKWSDLDAIILKALRKEPDRRYENAGDMLDDIRRYENDVPLVARRDTVHYRLGKFTRRHSRSLSVAIAVIMIVIGLTAYYTWQLTYERDIARREAARAEQVSAFLADMFIASDPSEARGENITARDLLDRGAEHIGELADQPEVQTAMMQLIGRIYWSIGSYEEAVPILERAIELREENPGISPNKLALTHYTLGVVLHELGDYRRAIPHFEQAVEIFRMNPDNISAEYAASLENLGYVEDARRNYHASEELHHEALQIRTLLFGPDHPDVAHSNYSLGILRRHLGDPEGSIARHYEALRIYRDNEMVDTRLGARNLLSLGNTLLDKHAYEEAEDILHEALEINRRIHGDKYLDTGLIVRALATLNRNREDFVVAEQLYHEALEILHDAIGGRHVMVGQVLQELGDVYKETAQHYLAEQVYRKAIAIFESASHVHPLRTVTVYSNLGSTQVELGYYEEAESFLLKSLDIAQSLAQDDETHQHIVNRSLEELVVLYKQWGRPDKAGEYRERLAAES